MIVLGVDPGATTGWVVYDTAKRRVIGRGNFRGFAIVPDEILGIWPHPELAVIEKPVAYGPTRPPVVECAYVAGRLFELVMANIVGNVVELERRDVKMTLTAAVGRDVIVKDDATAWAALKLLHGGEASAKKGGALYGIKSHERAALACVVAWLMKRELEALKPAP